MLFTFVSHVFWLMLTATFNGILKHQFARDETVDTCDIDKTQKTGDYRVYCMGNTCSITVSLEENKA